MERLIAQTGRSVTAADAQVLVVDPAPANADAPDALVAAAPAALTAATVATANAAAPSGAYVQADEATQTNLVNALKTAVNAVIADNVNLRATLANVVTDNVNLQEALADAVDSHNALIVALGAAGVFL